MTYSVPFPSDPTTPIPFIDLVPQYRAIQDEIQAAVHKVFSEQKFILGDEVVALETEIAEYCDARHAIGCNSGTDALILALQALNIGCGDEVITSPFSFFATASSIVRAGATPVFVDIDPATYNLDPERVAAAITPRTKAIMPVHLFGQCCDMETLWRLAADHGLAIVEDAAQAIGAEYQGRRAGVLGAIGCFSFFPTKNLGGAGDGGVMTTDDPELATRLKRLRVHGDVGQYEHIEVGMNSRLDALQAAVVRVKLRHLESWTVARQRNAARYETCFEQAGLPTAFVSPALLPGCRHVFNQYTMRITDGLRDAVQAELKQRKVGCMVYYPKPLHLQKCFASLGYKPGQLPEAERASREVLSLPIYPELPASHQQRVIDSLIDVAHSLTASRTQRKAA